MALTVTPVASPNSINVEFPIGIYRGKLMDITFDNSYVTTGEILLASAVGWTQIFGAITWIQPINAAGTLMLPAAVKANAANTQLTFQAYRYDGSSAGKASLEEAANAFDASAFTGRFMLLGY